MKCGKCNSKMYPSEIGWKCESCEFTVKYLEKKNKSVIDFEANPKSIYDYDGSMQKEKRHEKETQHKEKI